MTLSTISLALSIISQVHLVMTVATWRGVVDVTGDGSMCVAALYQVTEGDPLVTHQA